MIQFAIYGVLAAVLLGGGATMWHEHTLQVEKNYQAKIDAQEAQLQKAAEDKIAAAVVKETEMGAAYEKGRAEAKTVTRYIVKKGEAYVAQAPVFSNPQCFVPAVGMQLLNGARSNAGLAALARISIPELPTPTGNSSGATSVGRGGGAPASPLATNAGGRSTILGVREQQSTPSGSGEVSGAGARAHPKPKPVSK